MTCLLLKTTAFAALAFVSLSAAASPTDQAAVAALDTAYQAAVKANDAAAMDRILAILWTLAYRK